MNTIEVEISDELTIEDLQKYIKHIRRKAPSLSQLYVWTVATLCRDPQKRGGVKRKTKFNQHHLNRVLRFAELMDEYGEIRIAQQMFAQEVIKNPDLYGVS